MVIMLINKIIIIIIIFIILDNMPRLKCSVSLVDDQFRFWEESA